MAGCGESVDFCVRFLVSGECRPASGKVRRNLIVFGALQQNLWSGEREEVARIAIAVPLRELGGRAAHEAADLVAIMGEEAVAGELEDETEVDGAGQGDHSAWCKLRAWKVEIAFRWQVLTAGDPEGEVAASGVPGHGEAGEVEGMKRGEVGGEVEALGGVLERCWPAATGDAAATVFHRPDGDPDVAQSAAEIAGVAQAVVALPPAAVEEDEQGSAVSAGEIGQPEIAELRGVVPVRNAVVGCEHRTVHEVDGIHGLQGTLAG